MKIQAVIVDDEALARTRVRQLLSEEPDIQVVGEFDNGRDAIAFIRESKPHLLFLDIQMPEATGFDVLRAFPAPDRPAAILTTAHNHHALEAFEVDALDYLLKPYQRSRFQEALRRAREHLHRRRSAEPQVASPADANPPGGPRPPSHITVKSGERTAFLKVEDLDYIESAANYAILHVGPERHILRETLYHLEARLPAERFVRINRSAIVNLNLVCEVRYQPGNGRVLKLQNGRELPVTRGVREIRQRLDKL